MFPGLPIASFLAAVLVLIPLPWHWRARNIPTLSIIFWLFVVNMTHGVNAIVWYHNVEIRLVVWCEIKLVTNLDIGANTALPAACFCLCIHLERIASGRQVKVTHSDKLRRTLVDLAICVGIPIVYMALLQGHLFDIVENFGCRPDDYVSIPEFFIMWLLPILFCLGTFVLSGLAFFHFLRRRAVFARHLANSSAGLTPARYFRLMAMSLVEMFWALTVISITLYYNYCDGLRPWISWDNVHSDFSRIGQFPTVLISTTLLHWTYFLWWTTPVSAYLFFVFFAFGADAIKEYGSCIDWLRCHVFRQKRHYVIHGAVLPSFRRTSPLQAHFISDVCRSENEDTCASPTDTKSICTETPSTSDSATDIDPPAEPIDKSAASSDPFALSQPSPYLVTVSSYTRHSQAERADTTV
ncbi:hypothetical fungal pheromone GPCR, STE3-type [Postia placenta Mad-698-R]|nr:hypothetical fungal pheromone GPCR, STE3-type [Postia placenta Mad-698-R]